MTNEELDRLAALIAEALKTLPAPHVGGSSRAPRGVRSAAGGPAAESRPTWLPAPIRPEPPSRGGDPAPWSGAGQVLGDIAPVRTPVASRHRADAGESAAAIRAAAAGQGAPNRPPRGKVALPAAGRRARALPITVKLGVSNRHLHLSPEHLQMLFGSAPLTPARALLQPGQFAANETVTVTGPKGRLEGIRIVGPSRGETQLELARSDTASLGVDAPVATSGNLRDSVGGLTLVGPHGRVELSKGVIVAARHLHLSPADALRWALRDGDRLSVRCGSGARAVTFHDVVVRSGPAHATELHLDADEARAAGVSSGDSAQIIAWREAQERRRLLITERDVLLIASRHERLPSGALLTPSAHDRARALGLLDT